MEEGLVIISCVDCIHPTGEFSETLGSVFLRVSTKDDRSPTVE